MKMYTIAELSKETGIPMNTIHWHIQQGTLPIIKVGGGKHHTGIRLITEDACANYKSWSEKHYRSRQNNNDEGK